ncbi:hypothetical protein H8923_01715 [Romboutsia hominis]|uniref:Phage major tail protein, phi13 family n=1 Tax=Romboutsia faecis TaxID=2764597 RepID=A0ABR7JKW8_9FIRM|nr:major tail protein [Romboutsia faecis]MBC5995465.1 hypothetical protein [Romboutsia faecis]
MAGKNYKQKIIFGMDNIHIAKINDDGTFGTIVPILGAKACEVSFESSEKIIYADNKPVYNDKRITKGSGKLSVLGLTMDEKALLAGVDVVKGGIALGANTVAPNLAVLFAQDKADDGKILTVIYNVQFTTPSIQAISTEGEKEEQIAELEFTCLPDVKDGLFFYTVDSTDEAADSTMVSNWFTEVQKPTSLPA